MATRYQRGNQNPYIEEEQTTQWPQEKVQKDKQRSTKHKTKDRVTRTPLTTGVNSDIQMILSQALIISYSQITRVHILYVYNLVFCWLNVNIFLNPPVM